VQLEKMGSRRLKRPDRSASFERRKSQAAGRRTLSFTFLFSLIWERQEREGDGRGKCSFNGSAEGNLKGGKLMRAAGLT